MVTQWGFLIKVGLGATFLAIAIKYGAPALPIAPTPANSLVLVLAPSLIIGTILGWRAWSSS